MQNPVSEESTYSEVDLLAYFVNLMETPNPLEAQTVSGTKVPRKVPVESDKMVLERVETRLSQNYRAFAPQLTPSFESSLGGSMSRDLRYDERHTLRWRVLSHVREVIKHLENQLAALSLSSTQTVGNPIRVGILSQGEFEALLRRCVRVLPLSFHSIDDASFSWQQKMEGRLSCA